MSRLDFLVASLIGWWAGALVVGPAVGFGSAIDVSDGIAATIAFVMCFFFMPERKK